MIAHIRNVTGISYDSALRCAQLYGWLTALDRLGVTRFYARKFAEESGIARTTVTRDLKVLANEGWINAIPTGGGIEFECLTLAFDEKEVFKTGSTVKPVAAEKRHHLQQAAATPAAEERQTGSALLHKEEAFKKQNKKQEEKGTSTSGLAKSTKEKIIQAWNEHKPARWKKLSAFSGPREATLKALGLSLDEFLEGLPRVLAAVKRDKFWPEKDIAWENFMGSGKNQAKSHFLQFLDIAGDADAPAPKLELVRWNPHGIDDVTGTPGRFDSITPGRPLAEYFKAALEIAESDPSIPDAWVPRLRSKISGCSQDLAS